MTWAYTRRDMPGEWLACCPRTAADAVCDGRFVVRLMEWGEL